MSACVYYVVGPSGAGKDSVLAWLAAHLPDPERFHFAKRSITRPAVTDAEQHESLSEEAFATLSAADTFALQWQANGLSYGVRRTEFDALDRGVSVIVNGSRAYLAEALIAFPKLVVIHITASPHILHQRLLNRGRESGEAIDARIQRSAVLALSAGKAAIEICNDGTIEAAGQTLLRALSERGEKAAN